MLVIILCKNKGVSTLTIKTLLSGKVMLEMNMFIWIFRSSSDELHDIAYINIKWYIYIYF